MVDANFVKYGEDSLRIVGSTNDLLGFLAQNGFAIGVILAIILIMFIFGTAFIYGWRGFKSFFPK
jgi:hypothetical protein